MLTVKANAAVQDVHASMLATTESEPGDVGTSTTPDRNWNRNLHIKIPALERGGRLFVFDWIWWGSLQMSASAPAEVNQLQPCVHNKSLGRTAAAASVITLHGKSEVLPCPFTANREWKHNVFCVAAHCCLWCSLSEVYKAAVDDKTVSICAPVVVRIEFCDIYEQKLFSSMFRDQESLKNPWRIPEIFKDRMITQASLQADTMLIAVAFSIFLSFSFIFSPLRYSRTLRVRTSHTNIRFSGQRSLCCDEICDHPWNKRVQGTKH